MDGQTELRWLRCATAVDAVAGKNLIGSQLSVPCVEKQTISKNKQKKLKVTCERSPYILHKPKSKKHTSTIQYIT